MVKGKVVVEQMRLTFNVSDVSVEILSTFGQRLGSSGDVMGLKRGRGKSLVIEIAAD